MTVEHGDFYDNAAIFERIVYSWNGGSRLEAIAVAIDLRRHLLDSVDDQCRRWLLPQVDRLLEVAESWRQDATRHES